MPILLKRPYIAPFIQKYLHNILSVNNANGRVIIDKIPINVTLIYLDTLVSIIPNAYSIIEIIHIIKIIYLGSNPLFCEPID